MRRQLLGASRAGAAFAVAALTGLLGIAGAVVGADAARAGVWVQTSCVNPDGSHAPYDGWKGYVLPDSNVSPPPGSTAVARCSGDSMVAYLSASSAARSGAGEVLEYTAPDGSKLVGGNMSVRLSADGYGYLAVSSAVILTPGRENVPSNTVVGCAPFTTFCQGGARYNGLVTLPANLGGGLYVVAGCVGKSPSYACSTGAFEGVWSAVAVHWASLLLSTSAQPTATDFRGSLLEPGAHGTASLAFTAADSGPGVYKVVVAIDGDPVYDGTPNTNAGKCVPVGVDAPGIRASAGGSGALMWQWQQPCLRSMPVDLRVRTTRLSDGPHELTVTVMNPAGDKTTALRRTITTNNRTTVSSTLTSDKAPAADAARPAPEYAVVLDAPTQALVRGVRRVWSRSGLTLSGKLLQSSGVPAHGVLVTAFARHAGQDAPVSIARTSTDAAGHWLLTTPPGPSRRLTIVYGEQPDPASPRAIKIRETVKPNVTLRVQALGGGRLRFSGRLKINPLGSPRPLVVIQTRTRKRRWQAVGTSLRVSKTGAYSVVYDGGPNVIGGSYAFRTVAHATSLFSTGISQIRRARVR